MLVCILPNMCKYYMMKRHQIFKGTSDSHISKSYKGLQKQKQNGHYGNKHLYILLILSKLVVSLCVNTLSQVKVLQSKNFVRNMYLKVSKVLLGHNNTDSISFKARLVHINRVGKIIEKHVNKIQYSSTTTSNMIMHLNQHIAKTLPSS